MLRKSAAFVAAIGLTIGLIGTGVSSSWSDTATGQTTVTVGTFGCTITSPVGVTSPEGDSVTYTAPEILDSDAGQVNFPFTVTNNGTIPFRAHLTQSVPVAPFTSTLADPVADVDVAAGVSHDYIGGLAWPVLDNGSLDVTATVTYTVTCGEVPTGPTQVTPVAPTAVSPLTCTSPGTIVIPSVAGVDYFVDGDSVLAGSLPYAPGTHAVTAAAQDGFQLAGYPAAGWDLDVATVACPGAAIVAPTKSDQACGGSAGSITIASSPHVEYLVDGVLTGNGVKPFAVGTYHVTAVAQTGYQLTGYPVGGWTLTIAQRPCISFVGVASAGSTYTAANIVGLPAGWQPGDTAIVFATNTTTATPPVVPTGWTALTGAAPAYGTAVSRVGSRVLQVGDTDTGIWANTRDIAVVVYRNVGSVGPAVSGGATFTTTGSIKYITFPALTKSSGSWLVGLGYLTISSGNYYWSNAITAPAGTVNRTAALAVPSSSYRLAVIDSNGGIANWTSQQVTTGFTHVAPLTGAMNGITLELKAQ